MTEAEPQVEKTIPEGIVPASRPLMVTLRDKRRLQAANEIASAAHGLYRGRGYQNVSVDDIAASVGCSPRTVYRYFGSKEGVLFYDLPPILDGLIQVLDEELARGIGPWTALTDAMAALIERYTAEHVRIAQDRMQLWLGESSLRARYMEFIATTEDAVTHSLQRAPAGTPLDIELAPLRAVAAIGAYRATLRVESNVAEVDMVDRLREVCAAIGHGLGDR